jgi:hypothetical protein
MLEKDLYPPLKKYFKDQGYKVFAEVPCFYRGVDFVAVNGDKHIAVEMKTSFNYKVIQQASYGVLAFGNSYVAFPVKKPVMVHDKHFWELKESWQRKVEFCERDGIGILEVVNGSWIFEALQSVPKKPYRIFDFSQYEEDENDVGGLPCQKGVSMGYMELKAIKEYVRQHPDANWKEIYGNVQNHYSSPQSMAGAMSQWRGFNLTEFKKSIAEDKYIPRNQNA